MKNLNTPPKSVTIGGKSFTSIKKAADALGISRTRISKMVKLKDSTTLPHLGKTFSPRRHEKIAAHKEKVKQEEENKLPMPKAIKDAKRKRKAQKKA